MTIGSTHRADGQASAGRGVSWGGGRRRAGIRAGALATSLGMTLTLFATPAQAEVVYSPTADEYSMANVTADMGAPAWWDAGYTGKGVDVAVIDSGVSPVPGLDGADKIINGPDLSFDSQASNLTYLDGYGHGTFMAGLIAGKDATLTAPYSKAPAAAYRGIAPDARIVNMKVGAADGAVDVTQVIAAINWAVQHKNDNGMNIRIISLSYGTNSLQKYNLDPLSFAVEQAWQKGLVVIASAGNTGYQRKKGAPGLANPAYNPYVMGVGGYDQMGTPAMNDDTMGAYSASSAGCGSCKNPDYVAIGSHLQGLRVPGGYIDTYHPEGIINDRFFRGSGTSQSAAVAAGAMALIFQKYPTITPDILKRFVMDNAVKVPGADSQAQGAGELSLSTLIKKTPPSKYTQSFTKGTGLGSLELSRGSDHLTTDEITLSGELDIFGLQIDPAALAKATADGTSWAGGNFLGRSWSGSGWNGRSWSGSAWTGRSWSGRSWSGRSWSDAAWTGRSWSGRSWSGSDFCGSTWTGKTWADGSWS